MKVQYDATADALYITLKNLPVTKTSEMGAMNVDYAEDEVVGFEILNAHEFLSTQETDAKSIPMEIIS